MFADESGVVEVMMLDDEIVAPLELGGIAELDHPQVIQDLLLGRLEGNSFWFTHPGSMENFRKIVPQNRSSPSSSIS